jgi:hypothetical protein
VALAVAVGALVWNKHRIVAGEEQRHAMDRASTQIYERVRDLVPSEDAGLLPEPTYLTGKVLPVRWGGLGVELDGGIYPCLPEALRARGDAEAGTVAVVVTNVSTLYSDLYSDNRGAPRGMISDVTLTLVDVAHHAVLGQKRFRQDPPSYHATDAQLDAYSDAFWAQVASYLSALPRR